METSGDATELNLMQIFNGAKQSLPMHTNVNENTKKKKSDTIKMHCRTFEGTLYFK